MIDEISKLNERVKKLEQIIESLSIQLLRVNHAEIVGKEYVAEKFGISQNAVIRGKNGTNKIPRISKPNEKMRFRKKDVDRVWATLNKSVQEKAAEYIRNAS